MVDILKTLEEQIREINNQIRKLDARLQDITLPVEIDTTLRIDRAHLLATRGLYYDMIAMITHPYHLTIYD
jgi:regulator of replication initiation timing